MAPSSAANDAAASTARRIFASGSDGSDACAGSIPCRAIRGGMGAALSRALRGHQSLVDSEAGGPAAGSVAGRIFWWQFCSVSTGLRRPGVLPSQAFHRIWQMPLRAGATVSDASATNPSERDIRPGTTTSLLVRLVRHWSKVGPSTFQSTPWIHDTVFCGNGARLFPCACK